MANKDAFSACHPLVNFLYFALVLAFSMFFFHPLFVGTSLLCSVAWLLWLRGPKGLRFTLVWMLPLMLLTAVINPLFNHRGATILAYFSDGNPLTLESMLYGLGAAARLVAVVCWFACYSDVMTSDKFVYLFGRVIPALSLLLSMTLRFVPKFNAQMKVVSEAQRGAGRERRGRLLPRVRGAVTVFSIMVTWSLENAIETADSMKGRGYGLPGRTAFSIYRFDGRDRGLLIWLLGGAAFIVAGALAGGTAWQYFPLTKGVALNTLTLLFPLCFLALCLTPLALNAAAARKWNAITKEARHD